MFTSAHDKLVDKCLLTTMLMQLKAAVLVTLFFEAELSYTSCQSITWKHRANNMKALSALTVAH